MRIVVYGEQEQVGALVDDHVIDLAAAIADDRSRRGEPGEVGSFASSLGAFVAAGAEALEAAARAIDHVGEVGATGTGGQTLSWPASEVTLRAPWPHKRIACAGANYGAHLLGMGANNRGETGRTVEQAVAEAHAGGQWGFWKVLDELAGPGDEVRVPARTSYFDYEGEAAIILGRRGRDIPASDIGRYVWGVTLLNDWSVRDDAGVPRPASYNLPKNFDRSASLGPCIVVGEIDPSDVNVETRVNGQLRQSYSTKDMIFSFGEVLEWLSRDLTFVPGDIISGGTSAGTAADSTKRNADGTRPRDLFLNPGDLVEVSSPVIGALANRLVAP